MIDATPSLFNLLFNSICSFLGGLLVVSLFLSLFRVGETRWRLAILSLPFLKILVDIWRGIPDNSFLFTGLDPWALPPHHKSFILGAGFSYYGPIFNVAFSANDPSGAQYTLSLGDLVYAWLSRNLSPTFPRALVLCALLVSAVLVIRRLVGHIGFERRRRLELADGVLPLDFSAGTGWRKPQLYLSTQFAGTPFTGGIFRPYICFPQDAHDVLTPAERTAVLRHEVAHIRSWDCLTNAAIQVLGDLFWFVPGYRYLSRRIDRIREILADRGAVQLGAQPEHLASALVRLKEAVKRPSPVLYSAFIKSQPLLKERVEYLIAPEKRTTGERLGWNRKWGRPILAFWIVGAVMVLTFGGNHEMEIRPLPQWVENLFQKASR